MFRRFVIAYSFVMLFLVISAVGTASAALGNATYTEAVGRQSTYSLHVASSRGTIYDRNLQPLTNASQKYIAAVVPTVDTIARLHSITDVDQRDEIRAAMENGKPFLMEVNSPVNTEGIYVFSVDERYSTMQPASNLIGYLENGKSGASGLEKYMDNLLAETGEIEIEFTVNALGQAITGINGMVTNTYSSAHSGVVVTLDADVQRNLELACAEIRKGAAVVLECRTGKILAMASFPALDPNHLASSMNHPDAPFVNRALCAYAPGSVFKLISAAAALENGWDYRETYICTGTISVDGMNFACYEHTAHGEVNLHTAIRQSCNGYFIHLLQNMGADPVLELLHAWDAEEPVGLYDAFASQAGHLPSSDNLKNPRACANFAFGQGDVAMTPLHVAGIINTIAMNGEYLEPQIYGGVVDMNMEISGSPALESRKIIEQPTAERLRAYMESTARFGTARIGAPRNCLSGIKTGTAQTGVPDENGEEICNYWYAGYICDKEDMPLYTIVIVEESGAKTKVPQAFQKIAEMLADFI